MTDLISVDGYKEIMGISSDAEDDRLELIIPAISDFVKIYCNSNIIDDSGSPGVTDVFDLQWDTHVVQLRDSPIISVVSVKERSSQADAYTTLINDGTDSKYEWYLDTITDSIIRTDTTGCYLNWPRGTGSVSITYLAGYAATPEPLKLALGDLIRYYIKDESKLHLATLGHSIDNPAPMSNSSEWPAHIKRVLDLYRV